uniref:Uncharacterized protein n=1 Tax=Anopheles albimanus TaxID=7167 RepID=A0A182FYX6_ANOAL
MLFCFYLQTTSISLIPRRTMEAQGSARHAVYHTALATYCMFCSKISMRNERSFLDVRNKEKFMLAALLFNQNCTPAHSSKSSK